MKSINSSFDMYKKHEVKIFSTDINSMGFINSSFVKLSMQCSP